MTDLPDGVTNAMFEQFVDRSPYSDSCPEVLAELAQIHKEYEYEYGEIFDEVVTGQVFEDLIDQFTQAEYDGNANKDMLQDTISFAIGKLITTRFLHHLKLSEPEQLAEAHARAAAKRGTR